MDIKATLPLYKKGVCYHTVEALNEVKADFPGWGSDTLKIPELWARSEGEGIKVAVLDTGCDFTHTDLSGQVVGSRDFTGGNSVMDRAGHGTFVSGIIAAKRNEVGFVGVSPKASLLIGKVLDDNGSGDFSWIVEGIKWAVEQGAHIINMSFGGPKSTTSFFDAIHYALFQGVHVIAAAGNEGSLGINQIGYPGRYGSVLTIGSHDRNGNPSGFTSRGGEIDFLAPGSNIVSTTPGNTYQTLSGTSFSAPFCCGLAALMLSSSLRPPEIPIRNIEDLRNRFLTIAAHPGYFDAQTGYGPLIPVRSSF